jgi:hypothetical protein
MHTRTAGDGAEDVERRRTHGPRTAALQLARGVLLLGAAMVLVAGAVLLADLARNGQLPGRAPFDLAAARHLNNILNRTLNQLMAVVFTTVAIAVPLTANMYSVKFLEFFIKDRVNGGVLAITLFAGFANTWIGYSLEEGFVPLVSMRVVTGLVALSFALLLPYLFYVFRFLHPNGLLARLESEIAAALDAAVRAPARATEQRRAVAEGIEHIAEIALRSVDRKDRNTAIESVLVLERVARRYGALRDRLPPAWFLAEPSFFLGFSSKAVDEINQSRGWVEMKLFSQLRVVLSSAIPALHDLTASVAKTLRKLGLEPPVRSDRALRELVMEYFNTFVRLALTRRDARSVFTVFDQYRAFAEALCKEHPDLALEVADYFDYYGGVAHETGLTFLVESIAHDLGALVRHAWAVGASNADAMLERFLHYDQRTQPPLPGVKKAQAILAGYFLLEGRAEPVERLARGFAGLDRAFLGRLKNELMRVSREKYWEVNERRMNLEYVPEPQRQRVRQFLESLGA